MPKRSDSDNFTSLLATGEIQDTRVEQKWM